MATTEEKQVPKQETLDDLRDRITEALANEYDDETAAIASAFIMAKKLNSSQLLDDLNSGHAASGLTQHVVAEGAFEASEAANLHSVMLAACNMSQSQLDNLSLVEGSACLLYSRSAKQWLPGTVVEVRLDEEANEEWLVVKYGNKKTKKLQRWSEALKVAASRESLVKGFEADIERLFAAAAEPEEDKALERVRCVLAIYKNWMALPKSGKRSVAIFDLVNVGLSDSYSFARFLADYRLVIRDKQKLPAAEDCECDCADDEEDCRIWRRQARDRQAENLASLFFVDGHDGQSEAENLSVFAQQSLDTAHAFLYHADRVKFESSDEEEQLKQIEAALARRRRRGRGRGRGRRGRGREKEQQQQQEKSSKFVTTKAYKFTAGKVAKAAESVDCFVDDVVEDLRRHKLSAEAVELVADKVIKADEYETDSILTDLADAKRSNLVNRICALLPLQRERALAVERLRQNMERLNNLRRTYSASYRFFYWPFYKGNQDRVNFIYKNGVHFRTEENPGYRLCDWFIPAAHANFKAELLQNKTATVQLSQWNSTKTKAEQKYKAWRLKPAWKLICGWGGFEDDGTDWYMQSENKWQRLYGIPAGAVISIAHLMALLFYCNFSQQQYEFTATFRRIYWNETDESLKKRHAEFHFWGKLLRETVECFGRYMQEVPGKVFHHGISSAMLFESTSFQGLSLFVSLVQLLHFVTFCSLRPDEHDRGLLDRRPVCAAGSRRRHSQYEGRKASFRLHVLERLHRRKGAFFHWLVADIDFQNDPPSLAETGLQALHSRHWHFDADGHRLPIPAVSH